MGAWDWLGNLDDDYRQRKIVDSQLVTQSHVNILGVGFGTVKVGKIDDAYVRRP